MKRQFAMFGAALGLLWGLLVVWLSDKGTSNSLQDFAIRAAVACTFTAVAAAAGWLVGWVVDQLRCKR